MAGKKEKTAHVRRQKIVQPVEAHEQPDEHMDDITGFQDCGAYRGSPEGEPEQRQQGEEMEGQSAEMTEQGDEYEGGLVNQSRPEDEREVGAGSEGGGIEPHEMTPYVASCSAHVETLRKRKREQEERVEALVQESFGHVEAIMNYLVANLQQSHAASRTEFDAVDARISQSLATHNRIEKKMKMIAAILLHGQDELAQDE